MVTVRQGWRDLYPTNPQARARVDHYLHWHHRNTREVTIRLFAPAVRPDLKIPKAMVLEGDAVVGAVMSAIETMLAGSGAFLASDCAAGPTLADFACYAELGQCQEKYCGLWDFEPYPQIRRWMAAMEALPGFAASHADLGKAGPAIKKMAAEFRAKL